MSARIVAVMAAAILGLAVAPWVISSCAARPIVPEVYAAERAGYETRVAESQQATRTAERQQPGSVNVVVIGSADEAMMDPPAEGEVNSLALDPPAPESPPTDTIAFTATFTATSQPVAQDEQATPTPQPTAAKVSVGDERSVTVRVIGTVTATAPYTATARVVIEPDSLQTPLATPTTAGAGTAGPAQPSPGMIAVEDAITEKMLAEQLMRDAARNGFRLSGLTIEITADGVTASGQVEVLPRLRQAAQVKGSFAVENENLVLKVGSVRLNSQDVTALYGGTVTSTANSSLYKLLPQRFVESFELTNGQVTVHSKTKSP